MEADLAGWASALKQSTCLTCFMLAGYIQSQVPKKEKAGVWIRSSSVRFSQFQASLVGAEERRGPGRLGSWVCATTTSEKDGWADAMGVEDAPFSSCLKEFKNSTGSSFQELQVGSHGTSESRWQLPLPGRADWGVSPYVIPGAHSVFR